MTRIDKEIQALQIVITKYVIFAFGPKAKPTTL